MTKGFSWWLAFLDKKKAYLARKFNQVEYHERYMMFRHDDGNDDDHIVVKAGCDRCSPANGVQSQHRRAWLQVYHLR